MAVSKLLLLSIVFLLVFLGIRADVESDDEGSDSLPRLKVEQLKSKISALESQMEKIIQEKYAIIASLRSEIESLQNKVAVDAEKLVGNIHARAKELEKQVEELRNGIQTQNRKRDPLESQASEAEKKIQDLNLKLESLHGAWLPPWLTAHISHYQDFAATHWNEHGNPALDVFLQKASEKLVPVQKWVEPHLETAKAKWIPAVKEKWMTFTTYIGQYVQSLSTKIIEVYEASKNTITPHIVRVKEQADPYFQEAKKISKQYVDHVDSFTKPPVQKVQVALKPYTESVIYAYGEGLKTATKYHHQVQTTLLEKLKKHDLTKHLATKELVWFMASALLALPMFFLYRLFSAIFCKKARKPTRNAQANHEPRRHKRRHADK